LGVDGAILGVTKRARWPKLGRDESVGDSLEDREFDVGSFEPSVGGPVGAVGGEDLVSQLKQGVEDWLELGEGAGLVGVEELTERLVAPPRLRRAGQRRRIP